MKHLFLIILSLLCILPLSAKKKVKKAVATVPQTQEQRIGRDNARKFQYFYIEAMRQQTQGRYAEAFDLLRHCLVIDSLAAEAHYGVARYYAVLGNDSLAKMHYEKAVALEPQNGEFTEQLGEYYLQHNDLASATELYERISRQYPDRTMLLEVLTQIYEHQKDYPKLLETLNRLETVEGASEGITLSKMQVYSYMGNDEGAFNEISSLVKAHPNDLNYQVMMGNWLLATGKKQEALEAFLKVIKEEHDHAQAQMSLMDYYRADGKNEAADTLLYALLENPKTEPSTRVTLMQQVVRDNEQSGGDSTRVLSIFDRVLQLPQKTSEMAEMKVSYLQYKKMPADSIKAAIEQVLSIQPENAHARLMLIDILWRDSIDERVIEECEKAVEYIPDSPDLYFYLGLANYINQHDVKALDALQHAAGKISDETSKDMSARIFVLMGDILHKQGRVSEAYAAYDSCLVYNPDEISCLNNYAYFLSVENKDLKRAEQMSYKAIKAEPKNPTYLDTYAWILYMQGRYEEARIYIDQTLKNDSTGEATSADVLIHAGDIYAKLGLTKEALDFYERALLLDPEDVAALKKKIQKLK